MRKKWYNVKLSKENANFFKEYLRVNEIEFEPREAHNLVHIQCKMDQEELYLANKWLKEYVR